MTAPRKRGRPRKAAGDALPASVTFRVTPEQRAAWEAAAAAEGARRGRPLVLAAWAREVLDEKAGAR